jgi:hypothetical protein
MSLFKINNEKLSAMKKAQAQALRQAAYKEEADPLFFKAQRGEIDLQVWLNKVNEIKKRFSDNFPI